MTHSDIYTAGKKLKLVSQVPFYFNRKIDSNAVESFRDSLESSEKSSMERIFTIKPL